jgi:hypothetical protein
MECLGLVLLLIYGVIVGIPADILRGIYYSRARKLDKQKQKDEGYSIKYESERADHWLIYNEGDKEVPVGITYPSVIFSRVRIWPDSTTHWIRPFHVKLTEEEHERIFKRVIEHLSVDNKVMIEKGLY